MLTMGGHEMRYHKTKSLKQNWQFERQFHNKGRLLGMIASARNIAKCDSTTERERINLEVIIDRLELALDFNKQLERESWEQYKRRTVR